MINQEPVTSLKGIGEKTAALFRKIGVETVEDLIHDYPRAYDVFEAPVPVGQLTEGSCLAVSGQILKAASVKRFNHMQIIVTTMKDMTGSRNTCWRIWH